MELYVLNVTSKAKDEISPTVENCLFANHSDAAVAFYATLTNYIDIITEPYETDSEFSYSLTNGFSLSFENVNGGEIAYFYLNIMNIDTAALTSKGQLLIYSEGF